MRIIEEKKEQIKNLREKQTIATSIDEINRLGNLIFNLEEELYRSELPNNL